MRYYLIAGEASGDIHGANLMVALKRKDKSAVFRCWGGDRMQAINGTLVKHFADSAFMGFVDVIRNLPVILKNIIRCRQDIMAWQPDVVIFIDYPGFNIRIADWLYRQKKFHGKLIYYISPQVWAWKSNRAWKLKKILDEMLVILPFEKAFFSKYDFTVHYVGHPLLDELVRTKQRNLASPAETKPLVAILPGSRKGEVKTLLPTMLAVADQFPEYEYKIAAVGTLPAILYDTSSVRHNQIEVVFDQTEAVLSQANYALVASGTATLQTALQKVPQIVCYRGSRLNYLLAKNLVKVKYISLVNLILDQPLVKELIQNEFTVKNLASQFKHLRNEKETFRIMQGYQVLTEKLGGPGASDRAAEIITKSLS